MQPCIVDVSKILDVRAATIELSGELEIGDLTVGAEEFVAKGPASYSVTVTNCGTGLVANGRIELPVTAICSRCLCDFATKIEGEVEGFYVHPGHDEDVPEEQDVEYISIDETIDLGPALLAALILDAPFAPLHDENCAGICPTCGADLNEGPCECPKGDIPAEHPFAALKSLLETNGGDERDQRDR